jgi:hypothetical protein
MTDKVNEKLVADDAANRPAGYDGHRETIWGCVVGGIATLAFMGLGLGAWYFGKWLTSWG